MPIFHAICHRCTFPSRRFPLRFSRRFPISHACPPPYRFPTYLRRRPSLPCSCPPIARPRISPPVAASSDFAHISSPSMPPARPDIAAARPSRRMAPRWAGRISMACPFGAYRHGSRWRQPDMLDAIHDARVPAGHRGSRYPILIWRRRKRAECCMRVEPRLVAIPGSLAYRISSQNRLPCNFDPFVAGRIICSGWVWLSRTYWNHGRGIAHGGSVRLR